LYEQEEQDAGQTADNSRPDDFLAIGLAFSPLLALGK